MTFGIPYRAESFPAGIGLASTGSLHATWAGLVWAAITVGRWRDDLFIRGRYSAFEAIYKVNFLWAYLHEEGGGLLKTAAYDDLDPTEKSGVSYLLGMTSLKLFAAHVLGVPWLMHLDRYRLVHSVDIPSKSRPDVIGPRDPLAMTDWLVAEAKGRTNELRAEDAQTMRDQKGQVLRIGSQTPWLRIGCACHFTFGPMEVIVVDPEEDPAPQAAIALLAEMSSRQFATAYYGPIVAMLAEEPTAAPSALEVDARARYVPEADLWIGLTNEVFDALRSTQPESAFTLVGESRVAAANGLVGVDGVVIGLGESWESESMRLEPGRR